MKRPRKRVGSAAAAFALTASAALATGGDENFFVSAAPTPAVTSQPDHLQTTTTTIQTTQPHEISPRSYRSVTAHYYPGPILRSGAKYGEKESEGILQAKPISMEPSSIVMNSFEHRGLLRSRSSKRRRMEDLGLAGDASIASNEEVEPGTPGGWWEKLYVSGEYPEGRRGASAAVFRVMEGGEHNADDENGTNDRRTASTAMLGENRPAPHTTSHAGASSSSAAEMTRTPPSPGDPLPIPGHMSPSLSTSSKTLWRPPDYDKIESEYMVVSGGFSDDDWSAFPVWALDMSGDSQPAEFRESYKWFNLGGSTDNGPEARVGHMSAIHEGHLYVFGGLLYDHANFFLENGAFVWRARIDDQLPPSAKTSEELHGKQEGNGRLEWERLIPKIVDPRTEGIGDKPTLAIDEDGRFEPIPSRPINEGEVGDTDDDEAARDGPHDRRGLGAIPAKQDPSPYRLPRGEIQGGHWHPSNPDGDDSIPRSAYVFYGGLHVSHKTTPRKYTANPLLQVDEPLGDVWMYDFSLNEFHRLAPYPPESWQTDPNTGLYPEARTAHGATVVGGKLIIHGGMKINTDAISYNGETNWDPLSDCWEFDLVERVWRQRLLEPKLARSYHSLVGWGDGSIAAFGGYRSADTIAGDAIAFVFSDVLVNHPDENWWLKAQWPQIYAARTISNRLEHVAVVDKEGSMFAWGGRFKTTSQVSGTWKIDVFNEDSTVIMAPAPPDGYDAYEAELEALHLLVSVMMFMSIIFTALYGSVRRQQMEMAAAVEGNATAPGIMALAGGIRRSGLPQATVDSFPVKIYSRNDKAAEEAEERDPNETNFVIDSEDDDAGAPHDGLEEEETCPICLVEYEDGDEVRTLSCGHDFHKGCVDEWLSGHTSCPGCRQNFSNSTSDTIPIDANENDLAEENYDPTWENLRRSVWGEAPAFISPQMLSLANMLASHNAVPSSYVASERPREDPDTSAAPQDASSMIMRPEMTPAESSEVEDQDEFTNDESGMAFRGVRRPPRLRLGRARGYRSVRPQVSATEMVEVSTGSSSVV